jgi:hypothetical protein
MAPIRNTYTIPFDPVGNSKGEFTTAKESFNCQQFQHKRGSRVSLYPAFVDVYRRSEQCVADGDTFEDLMLADMVEANKRWGKCRRIVCYSTDICSKGFSLSDPGQ